MGLPLLRVALVAASAALLAASCGGSSHSRDALTRYIDAVNTTEVKMAAPIREVTSANQAFAREKGGTSASVERQLAHALATMRELRRRLARLEPPAEAARLHRLLLRLAGREIGLAREVEELSRFVPRYQAALRPLTAADRALQRVLARSAKGAAAVRAADADKAAALDAYGVAVTATVGRLRGLDPPPVWQPAYRTQITTLTRLHASGAALAAAIRANEPAAIPALLHRFDAAAVADASAAAQRRQIAAVKAYDARVQSLSTLARQIEHERNRLQRVYG